MLLADPRFELALQKQWKFILTISIASLLVMLGASFTGVLTGWDALSNYSVGYVFYQLLRSMAIWSWMLFVLYFGLRVLNFSNKILDYADEAILPFYVLHHPVIVVTAFLTFPWGLALGVKYLVVSTVALLATLALYELCIRRINIMRWLFGMKLLHASRPEPSPGSGSSPPVQHCTGP
jgi:surface polysaccharide O-acyltransferase-like enzyme